MIKKPNKQTNKIIIPSSVRAMRPGSKQGEPVQGGSVETALPSRRPWQNHINASHRRSLYFAKHKTVSLQIYGNNVTGAKGCHFESKKAHFIVALMANDVKANYTPTCWERNQSQERNVQLETHPQEFGKPALLPSHANLSQAQTKDVFSPSRNGKDWWWDSLKGVLASSSEANTSLLLPRGGGKEWEPQGSLPSGIWIQKGESWAETERDGCPKKELELLLQVVLRFQELLEWTGRWYRREAWLGISYEILGMSQTPWARAQL